jgi:UDP-N-acetylmuramoylalanine--D-glutamate ligase
MAELTEGVFLRNGIIVIQLNSETIEIMPAKDIKIPGSHNIENALAATALAYTMGIRPEVIADTLRSFKGVTHRIEFVDRINDVSYINDSKATNPDAAIKALEAVSAPIILLAGGMDKESDFTELINAFNGKVKEMIVYGETAEKLYETARNLNFKEVKKVKGLDEAVKAAHLNAKAGDSVLLSPACASWDMYKNFEERGNHFKSIVSNLRRS